MGEVGDVGETDPLGVDDADVRLGGVGAFSGDSEERFGEKSLDSLIVVIQKHFFHRISYLIYVI
jgi:hypothetical protein